MNRINVLDASAVLAYLQQETGQDRVEAAMDEAPCWMNTVNVCEVLGKLCEREMPLHEAQAVIDDLGLLAKDFDSQLAAIAAQLRLQTKSIGASLGDRACLAMAQQAAAAQPQRKSSISVYTAEQAWAKLKWPFKIVVIR